MGGNSRNGHKSGVGGTIFYTGFMNAFHDRMKPVVNFLTGPWEPHGVLGHFKS